MKLIRRNYKRILLIIAFLIPIFIIGGLSILKYTYKFIINSDLYKQYHVLDGVVPFGTREAWKNHTNDGDLELKYRKSFCCERCQCDPAGYIDVLEDKMNNIYWIYEYDLGPGADKSIWYGPFKTSFFSRYEFVSLAGKVYTDKLDISDKINLPQEALINLWVPDQLLESLWKFDKEKFSYSAVCYDTYYPEQFMGSNLKISYTLNFHHTQFNTELEIVLSKSSYFSESHCELEGEENVEFKDLHDPGESPLKAEFDLIDSSCTVVEAELIQEYEIAYCPLKVDFVDSGFEYILVQDTGDYSDTYPEENKDDLYNYAYAYENVLLDGYSVELRYYGNESNTSEIIKIYESIMDYYLSP